ncbi:MAG: SAM-dependent methyltransferase, partial [Waddliaceae bacterium]|nr:SAM-dependent methyltransferase [Waddliaceae bacterium]
VFDFWYGPAVLSDKPATKIKRLENDDIKVTRLSEPVMYPERNVVDVNFDVFIEDKSSHEVTRKKELHTMRYLFDTELSMICDKIGFDVVETKVWMDDKQPNFESWNVVWIVKK